MSAEQRRELYTTVFSQVFSPCGRYLVSANNFGRICVFDVDQALTAASAAVAVEGKLPVRSFSAHASGHIYSLVATERFLVSGASREVCGWQWSDVLHTKNPKPSWTLVPPVTNPFEVPETNSMVYNSSDNSLVTGCGDNNVYIWDLEGGSVKQTLSGHTDYVHCVDFLKKSEQVVSASEDGTVRFWDLRSPPGSVESVIDPNKNEEAARPDVGKWVSCLAVHPDEDWMVCGGAAHLSVWHLRSKTTTAVLPTPNSRPQVATFHDDLILSAGSEPNVFHWSVNGETKCVVPVCATSIYSLAVNRESSNQVLAIGGSSSTIDVCTNFSYKAFSFHFK